MIKLLDRQIGTCKDCKHWQKLSGYHGRCTHFDKVWRGNSLIPLEHGTNEEFYCADFEKQGSEE